MSLKSVRGRTTVVGPAKEYPAPLPLNAANYAGAWAFSDGRMSYSDGVSWQELISNISVLVDKTVGSGGDFATLGAALAYFAGFSPTAAQYRFLGRITILDGTVMQEQISMSDQNLGWVIIEKQTPYQDIDVDAAYLTTNDLFLVGYRAFMSFVSGSAPIINCRFKKVGTAPNDPATGSPFNTIGVAMRATDFVTIHDDALLFSGPPPTSHVFKAGIYNFSENMRLNTCRARIDSLEIAGGTLVNVQQISGTIQGLFMRVRGGPSTNNWRVGLGGIAVFEWADLQITQGVNTAGDIQIAQGAIATIGILVLGGTSDAEIVPSGNGIVFDGRSAVTPIWEGFIKPQAFTVATLPVASAYTGSMVYVSDETGGATVAFSDGTDWRRVQDRVVVS